MVGSVSADDTELTEAPVDGFYYARIGYDGYAASTGGKTFDGRTMPKWDELPDRIKEAWRAAANAILAGGAPSIEARAATPTMPALEDLDFDPDSKPTPIEVPHPQR